MYGIGMARRRTIREIQAAAVLLRRQGGLAPSAPILDATDLAESATRLRVYQQPLPLGIRGLLADLDGQRPALVLNTRLAGADRNVTAAHELGHWVLHAGTPHNIGSRCGRQRLEWEANRFAAELLLPEELVRRAIRERRCSAAATAARLGVRGSYLSRRIRELRL